MQCYTPYPYRYCKHVSVCFSHTCSMHMHVQLQRNFTHGPSASVCPCVTSAFASNNRAMLSCFFKDVRSNTGLRRSRRICHACALFARDVLLKRCAFAVVFVGAAKQDATTHRSNRRRRKSAARKPSVPRLAGREKPSVMRHTTNDKKGSNCHGHPPRSCQFVVLELVTSSES